MNFKEKKKVKGEKRLAALGFVSLIEFKARRYH